MAEEKTVKQADAVKTDVAKGASVADIAKNSSVTDVVIDSSVADNVEGASATDNAKDSPVNDKTRNSSGAENVKVSPAVDVAKDSSANKSLLYKVKTIIESNINVKVEDSYLNELGKYAPTFVVSRDSYARVARDLRENKELQFDYLVGLHGTDFGTHFEINVQLRSIQYGFFIILKTKVDREVAEVDSLTSIWPGANWLESECYDLLGIKFNGNKELNRIFLGDDWEGYPLRKDYQPYDKE